MAKETSLAANYYNIVIIGMEILYEASLMDPGAVEDLGNVARQVIECTGKRTNRLTPRTREELHKEADWASQADVEALVTHLKKRKLGKS